MSRKPLEELPNMMAETYRLVAQVPKGRVTTYGDVAKALGDVVASRFVGLAMSLNEDIVAVPCRRVVQSDGSLGGYTGGGARKKAELLRKEGLRISDGKVVDFEAVRFSDFETDFPLRKLRKVQNDLSRRLSLSRFKGKVDKVAGIDVAYRGDMGYAAMVSFDYRSGKELDRSVIEGVARFPYIPTYLAFREIPVIESLMDLVDERTILMFDGNGILHPEGFGITSQIGVVFDVPTIGVAKRLLCGSLVEKHVSGVQKVAVGGKVSGYAVSKEQGGRPVYVSPGHKVSPEQALEIAKRFLKHRVPEPTRIAHIVAEEARRRTSKK